MSTQKRIATLRVLVEGHSALASSPKLSRISGEFERIGKVTKIPKHNGWLLCVLHTTRALDTTLSELIVHRSWFVKTPSLGAYLKTLEVETVLTSQERIAWQTSIVDKRNRYMHSAGEMPDQIQTDSMLSDMEACLTIVLSRT